jgi:hypothetical protein
VGTLAGNVNARSEEKPSNNGSYDADNSPGKGVITSVNTQDNHKIDYYRKAPLSARPSYSLPQTSYWYGQKLGIQHWFELNEQLFFDFSSDASSLPNTKIANSYNAIPLSGNIDFQKLSEWQANTYWNAEVDSAFDESGVAVRLLTSDNDSLNIDHLENKKIARYYDHNLHTAILSPLSNSKKGEINGNRIVNCTGLATEICYDGNPYEADTIKTTAGVYSAITQTGQPSLRSAIPLRFINRACS